MFECLHLIFFLKKSGCSFRSLTKAALSLLYSGLIRMYQHTKYGRRIESLMSCPIPVRCSVKHRHQVRTLPVNTDNTGGHDWERTRAAHETRCCSSSYPGCCSCGRNSADWYHHCSTSRREGRKLHYGSPPFIF